MEGEPYQSLKLMTSLHIFKLQIHEMLQGKLNRLSYYSQMSNTIIPTQKAVPIMLTWIPSHG